MMATMDNEAEWLVDSATTTRRSQTLTGFPSKLAALQYDYTSPLAWFPASMSVTEDETVVPYPAVASVAITDATSRSIDLAALLLGHAMFFGTSDPRNVGVGQRVGLPVRVRRRPVPGRRRHRRRRGHGARPLARGHPRGVRRSRPHPRRPRARRHHRHARPSAGGQVTPVEHRDDRDPRARPHRAAADRPLAQRLDHAVRRARSQPRRPTSAASSTRCPSTRPRARTSTAARRSSASACGRSS